MNNQQLYNKIMGSISKSIKQTLNEDSNPCRHSLCSSVGEDITQFYKGYEIVINRFRCDNCGYEYWSFSIYSPSTDYYGDEEEEQRYVSGEHFKTDRDAFIAAKAGIDQEMRKRLNNKR